MRFAIAGLVMLAVAHRAVLALPREMLRRAVVVGGIYGVAQILQTAGLAHTAASVSGFITGMYVVCTPLLAAVLLKTRITADHLGRGRAGHGRARRAHPGRVLGRVRRGAHPRRRGALRAAHRRARRLVDGPGRARHVGRPAAGDRGRSAWSPPRPTASSFPTRAGTGPPSSTWRWWPARWRSLAQTWAQSQLSPTRTAIIMSMEPVFAAFFAVLLGGEDLTSRMLLGGAHGAGRDARGRGGAAAQGRGRGPAPHRLTRTGSAV